MAINQGKRRAKTSGGVDSDGRRASRACDPRHRRMKQDNAVIVRLMTLMEPARVRKHGLLRGRVRQPSWCSARFMAPPKDFATKTFEIKP